MRSKTVLIIAILVAMGFCFPVAGTAQTKLVTLASGSPGGVYYPLGGGMAVIIQKTVKGLRCAAESTGASVENVRLVDSHESDMAMVMGSSAYSGREGREPFKKKHDIVAMFQMYPAPTHIVTTKKTGIKKFEDLKGKKVSIDRPGSGGALMARVILDVAGFNLEKDINLAGLSVSESVTAMKDGLVDALFLNFAYPASAIMDLISTRDIELIPLSEGLIKKIIEKHPYYVKTTIPKNAYQGMTADIMCLGDSNLMVVHKDMDADLVYKIVKALFENINQGDYALINIHPIAAQFTPSNAVNSPIPLHPGAIKYFKERGVIK